MWGLISVRGTNAKAGVCVLGLLREQHRGSVAAMNRGETESWRFLGGFWVSVLFNIGNHGKILSRRVTYAAHTFLKDQFGW